MTTRADGLRRVGSATFGLAAASVAGVVVVSAVISHEATRPSSGSAATAGTFGSITQQSSGQFAAVQPAFPNAQSHAITSGS